MFDIFELSLFNQVLIILGRSMSKFLLFLMGLEIFIRIPLLNLSLVDELFPSFLEFIDKDINGN
jgi:hypothetical protein